MISEEYVFSCAEIGDRKATDVTNSKITLKNTPPSKIFDLLFSKLDNLAHRL